ncbi:unnamed protein product [Cylicostephanus goldi]|uniref:Uncharacterized protein n=1 Tax=Cylicostephanus goldi TaxID=71465 RepID=A0A3P7MP82_CYLGO|nr:unnamed protein product [Cylicostephanus goldi]
MVFLCSKHNDSKRRCGRSCERTKMVPAPVQEPGIKAMNSRLNCSIMAVSLEHHVLRSTRIQFFGGERICWNFLFLQLLLSVIWLLQLQL